MKKVVSVFLVLVMLTISGTPAFAAQNYDCTNYPFIVISGMANFPLYLDDNSGNGTMVFPPTLDKATLTPLVKAAAVAAYEKDWLTLTNSIISTAYNIFAPIGCNPDGSSIYAVTTPKYPLSIDHYPEMTFKDLEYGGRTLLDSAVDRYGGDHVFFFNYDWRLSPIDNAEDLNDFINNVKQVTRHNKVNLAACSLGGAQAIAYFNEYGGADVNSCAFICSAFTGNLLGSDLLSEECVLNSESLVTMLSYMIMHGKNVFLAPVLNVLYEIGKLDKLMAIASGAVNSLTDRLYDDVLAQFGVTMPGLWSFVQADQYEYAKDLMLDDVKNAALIAKIDDFQYNVHQRADEIVNDIIADGTKVAFITHYNIYSIPIYASATAQNDGLVETTCSSGGAICAPVGSTLPQGYVQQNYCGGHNHISADNIIDASTCMFPDYTWFCKSITHVGASYASEYNDFIFWLVEQDTQPDIWQNTLYPQFMSSDDNGKTLTALVDNPQPNPYPTNIVAVSQTVWHVLLKISGIFKSLGAI